MGTVENRQLISDFVATVFNGHDIDALPRFVANERLVGAASGLVRGVPDVELVVEHLIAEGDLVAIRVTGHGTHSAVWRGLQPTRKTWEATCNAHYRIADGKIVDFWVNWDWLSIMQQLGAIRLNQ
jgi:predicted ester cyclase